MFLFAGHHKIECDRDIVIVRSDINKNEHSSQSRWTFQTSTGCRIRFKFHEFGFYWSSRYYSALEIGDGISPGISSRLVHFRGLQLPSGVTSVSHGAWMIVYDPGSNDFTRLHRQLPKYGL